MNKSSAHPTGSCGGHLAHLGCKCRSSASKTELADLDLDSVNLDSVGFAEQVETTNIDAALTRWSPRTSMLVTIAASPAAVDTFNERADFANKLTPERLAFLRGGFSVNFLGDVGYPESYDTESFRVAWGDDGPHRITPCCEDSAVRTDNGGAACSSCMSECDAALARPAELVRRPAGALTKNPAAVTGTDIDRVASLVADSLVGMNDKRNSVKASHWDATVIYRDFDTDTIDFAWENTFRDRDVAPRIRGEVLARVHHDGRVDTALVGVHLETKARPDGAFDAPYGTGSRDVRCYMTPGCVLVEAHYIPCTSERYTAS